MIEIELDRRIPVPLYYQLQQQLRQAILDGRIAPGALLPPEPDLAVSAGVSRFTVRQAVEQLVREGLVRRERGRGTFVADEAAGADTAHAFQFSHVLDRLADDVTARVEHVRTVAPPDGMRQLLPPNGAASVHEVCRVHEVRRKPIAVEYLFLPTTLMSEVESLDLTAPRIHPLFERQFGLRVSHAEETLRAANASGDVASLLGVPEGSAAFRIDRRSWSGTNLMEVSSITLSGQMGLSRIVDSAAQLTVF